MIRFWAPRAMMGVAMTVLLAGCSLPDTYRRPGVWHPDGANAANIAAMAETPADLVRGRSDQGSLGTLSAAAIERLSGAGSPRGSAGSQAPGGQGVSGKAAGAAPFAPPIAGTGGP